MAGNYGFSRGAGIRFCALCCVVMAGIITIVASSGSISSDSDATTLVINSSTAEEIAISAYEQGSSGVTVSTGSLETVSTLNSVDGSASGQALSLPGLVINFLETVGLSPGNPRQSRATLHGATIDGSCGGYASLDAGIDVSDQEFSLEADFSDYCMGGGVVLNGTMTISGELEMGTDQVLAFSVVFSDVTVSERDSGDSSTISGLLSMTLSDLNTATSLMDLSITDDATAETFIVDDFTVTLDGLVSSVLTFTMSGAFTHPDHGTFTVATTTPFMTERTGFMPYQGALVVTAADNSFAELTILSTATYQVRADTDGDGTIDLDTGTRSW